MNATDIRQKVQEGADARFGDTVDKLLLLLRRQHTHQCHTGECICEYCSFISGEYTDSKISLHKIQRRIDRIDYWDGPDWELTLGEQLNRDLLKKLRHADTMKKKKFDMWKDVL
jgi:hypothetical protein